MLCSSASHMPLLYVWRDSGVTERHGFRLDIDVAGAERPAEQDLFISMQDRAPRLLDGSYDFLSGLHLEP
jgi:hypothetical protein